VVYQYSLTFLKGKEMAEKQEEVMEEVNKNPDLNPSALMTYTFCEDKELLAYLGHALYECQRLEVNIAYIIQNLHLLKGLLQGDDLLERLKKFQKVLDSRKKRTLAKLLKEIKEIEKLDNKNEHLLDDALRA